MYNVEDVGHSMAHFYIPNFLASKFNFPISFSAATEKPENPITLKARFLFNSITSVSFSISNYNFLTWRRSLGESELFYFAGKSLKCWKNSHKFFGKAFT